MAGLAKILLQMRHQMLAPTLHANPRNPEIDFAGSPFRLQTELAAWQRPAIAGDGDIAQEQPRRAGLSSFGAGGANAHIILEEYTGQPQAPAAAAAGPVVLPVSAKTPEQLRAAARNLRDWLGRVPVPPLADVAFTLQCGRTTLEHRLAVVAADAADAINALDGWLEGTAGPEAVFQGHVRGPRPAGATDSPVPGGDLAALARAWISGLTVDWIAACGRHRRVSLPTYPFARERYWKPELPYPDRRHEAQAVHRSFTLDGSEPFLRDHRVGGRAVLPGVAYLELARQAEAGALGSQPLSFRDTAWISPFTVDGQAAALRCDIEPKGGDSASFTFTSERNGKTVLHCKGMLARRAASPPPPRHPAALAGECGLRRIEPETLQAAFRRMGVEYGGTHRLLGPVAVGLTAALAPLAPAEATHDPDGLWPGLLDSAFQAALCLIDGVVDDVSATTAPLPFGLRQLEIYQRCDRVRWVAISRQRTDASRVEIDLDLLADDGTVCLRFSGLSSRQPPSAGHSPGNAINEQTRPAEQVMNDLLAHLVRAVLPARPAILPFYQAWLEQTDRFLAAVPVSPAGLADLWQAWRAQRSGWLDDPLLRPRVALLEAALPALDAVLTGARKATDVLFPNASLALVQPIYDNNPLADAFNDRLVTAVTAWLEARPRHASGGQALPIRILEIGAGTGGTSRRVLPALRPFQAHIGEYCFTDRSHVFLRQAERDFGAGYPFLHCRLLDIEQPVEQQGLEAGGYDLVIAANVLHATRDMRRTMTHVRRAIRDGGLLVLNELAGNALYAHVTFGLLEGWWGYTDPELRLPGSPGLAPAAWQRVLEEQGFIDVAFPAADIHHLGQQIVTAAAGHTAAFALIRDVNTMADEEAARRFVRRTIRENVARSLKLDESRLEDDQSFSDYGVDSILAVNLVNDIAEAVDAPLTTTVLFDHNTVERLTRHILETHADKVRAVIRKDAGAVPRAADGQRPPAERVPSGPAPLAALAGDPDRRLVSLLQAFDELDPQPSQTVLLLTADAELAAVANLTALERGTGLIVGAGSPAVLARLDATGKQRGLAFDGPDFATRVLELNRHRKVDHIICALADVPDDLSRVLCGGGQWLDLE
jgi:acyl transferase domain-containing protein/acyl carrier protein